MSAGLILRTSWSCFTLSIGLVGKLNLHLSLLTIVTLKISNQVLTSPGKPQPVPAGSAIFANPNAGDERLLVS